MKNKIIFLLTIMLIAGCGRTSPKEKRILARINNYEITLDEFEQEYKASYGGDNTPESKKEFLKLLISRKLILQDAQQKGLDKEKDFLKMIERFWEQSLLKLALENKSKEIAALPIAGNRKTEEAKLMSSWMDGLEKNARICVDYNLLK